MSINICKACRQPYISKLEIHPRKKVFGSVYCGRRNCFREPNFSGLCDGHYNKWQSRFYKRIQRWWRGQPKVVTITKISSPQPISFLEDEFNIH